VILISVSLLTTIINYFFLRSSYLKIKELAEHTTIVTVIRDGNRQEIQSVELVPGDIFEPDGLIPCDCILIQGEIYVN
jgi:P-type E1-E2 ATPase